MMDILMKIQEVLINLIRIELQVGMFLCTLWYGMHIGFFDHPWLRKACAIIYGDEG